jgi:enoyl-CoA hydratase/carnithine racemase
VDRGAGRGGPAIGLVNRVVEPGTARQAAEKLAAELAEWPQTCLRSDREAVYRTASRAGAEGMEVRRPPAGAKVRYP